VLEGVALNDADKTPILVVGNHNTKYGSYLKNKFAAYPHIRFMGGIYNLAHLNSLRFFSNLYFHGHSVGGTNPSLLEAMASQALIAAHNNDFNRSILKENAYYFGTAAEVKNILQKVKKSDNLAQVSNNLKAIEEEFNWDNINGSYLHLFEQCLAQGKK
jgi:glycosyltransferase involved in cell wall biosynthesis